MTLRLEDDSNIYNQIKEAACVLFRSQGFENTSVSDLIEKLQIEERFFFIYFQSMDELLEVVWSES
jgi:AcrR family transcriptional regulator